MLASKYSRFLAALVFMMATSAIAQGEATIRIASTTSTEHSGLLEFLIPQFQRESGIAVHVVAVGSGQALRMGCHGDVDAVLVHAPQAEQQFVEQGCGADRRRVMVNDFVVVGPVDDPADVAGADSAAEAFQRIGQARAPFASRGDDSGTHQKAQSIWSALDMDPGGDWYRELGAGMGAVLNTAADMKAYTLADRGTWLTFANRRDLTVLFEGDPSLVNPYSSILVKPAVNQARQAGATKWHRWLVSEAGQAAIGRYRVNGQRLFIPVTEAL